jgi:hypothetical protein
VFHSDQNRICDNKGAPNADIAVSERDYLEQLICEHTAASFIGFSVKTLRNWRVSGGGPKFVKPSRRAIRYRRRELIAWADSLLINNTSE